MVYNQKESVVRFKSYITRRQLIKAGGIGALGLTFGKPLIETIIPKPAFANYVVSPTHTPTPTTVPPPPGTFILAWGSQGFGDGQFRHPTDVAIDTSGNVYVTDRDNHRVQKFASNGTYVAQWSHDNPTGIAVDSVGNVYVLGTPPTLDPVNPIFGFKVTKYTHNGVPILEWGGGGIWPFSSPQGITVDSANNVFVTDTDNHRVQKFTSTGTFLLKWGSEGSGQTSADGEFSFPWGIDVDSVANVYVVGKNSYRVQKFTGNGTFLTKWGSSGSADGQFGQADRIAVSSSGVVFVTDRSNHRVQFFDSDGTFIGKWGNQGSNFGEFFNPEGIAADSAGCVYVVDSGNHRVQKFLGA